MMSKRLEPDHHALMSTVPNPDQVALLPGSLERSHCAPLGIRTSKGSDLSGIRAPGWRRLGRAGAAAECGGRHTIVFEASD